MFHIVEEASSENSVQVRCDSCANSIEGFKTRNPIYSTHNKNQHVFFHKGELLTRCTMCGDGDGDQDRILAMKTECNCGEEITLRDIRENTSCPKCNETTTKVIAMRRYKG